MGRRDFYQEGTSPLEGQDSEVLEHSRDQGILTEKINGGLNQFFLTHIHTER